MPSNITLLGSAGGAARAVLALLNRAAADPGDPLNPVLRQAHLYLLDPCQKPAAYYDRFPNLAGRLSLGAMRAEAADALTAHLRRSRTGLLLDCSAGSCWEPLVCCDALDIRYVNTAVEIGHLDGDPRLAAVSVAARCHWLEARRGHLRGLRAIVGSGMNPGVVQWMALHLLAQVGGARPLACYVVEEDTTFPANPALVPPEAVCLSWSPGHYLEEAVQNWPMHVYRHDPVYDTRRPALGARYRVRLGAREFAGCLVPHEEVLSLGRHFDFEIGFLYKVNDHTTAVLRRHLRAPARLQQLPRVVLDPDRYELTGHDLVGVVLVYPDREEYLFNLMENGEACAQYGVGATYLQVACGVYAAACCLLLDPVAPGVHYVDDLILAGGSRYGRYVAQHIRRFWRGRNRAPLGRLAQRRETPPAAAIGR